MRPSKMENKIIVWNTLICLLLLSEGLSKEVMDSSSLEILVGERKRFKELVPAFSNITLSCTFANGTWFLDGKKINNGSINVRRIHFRKIEPTNAGVYSCRSLDNTWSNLTLDVLPTNARRINQSLEALSLALETPHELQKNKDESEDYFERDLDENVDHEENVDTHHEDGVYVREGTPPQFKHSTSLLRTLPKPSGSYIKLPCAASGNPTPNITWTKDGEPIKRTMGKVQYKKWAVSMEDAIPEDSGLYKCEVCNIHGCINHTTKLIIQDRVNHKPIVLTAPKNLTIIVNQSGEMECKFLSDLHHSIQWVFGTCAINCTDHSNSKFLQSDPENSDVLKLVNVTHEDEGWYTCVAANSLGTSAASAYLQVIDEHADDTVSEPVRNPSMWITIVTVVIALLFLLGTVFVVFMLRKLKHEKLMKHRMETVHQWTKKVIIYKPSVDPNSPETMVMPIVKIEKQRTTLLQNTNSDPVPFNEYEFPLDSNWEIPRNQLLLGTILGEGAFGRVVMAEIIRLTKSDSGSSIVAVKMVKEGHTDADMASLVREMEVMKMIGKHINIINLLGCCSQDGPLYVIVEYAPHGNLKDFLKKNRPTSDIETSVMEGKDRENLTQKDLISFAYQVARGMEYLASKRCIHRDLAARNVLVSDDYVIKIADFGLARDIQDTDYYRKNSNGRLPIKWMAPESLQDKFYDTQSDVWSYGILLWEIMTYGEQPYPHIISAEELYKYLKTGQRMDKPPRCSLNIYMLMRQCWNWDAQARPNFTEIVENLDQILTSATNANEEYLDLGIHLLETPPSSEDESDSETLREMSPLRYH